MKEKMLRGLIRMLARLPWPILHLLGRFVGWLVYRIDGREANDTRVNLQIAFPEMTDAEREQLVRDTLRESAITFCEMPRIWLGKDDLAARVDDNGLPQEMARLAGQGNGLILAMPHHGNWEMVSSGIDQSLRITGLYRPPRQAFLEPIMTSGRSIARIRMVPTDRSGIKALHDTLRQGDVVAILPDQVPKSAGAAGTAAPFFGRDSMTMVLLGRLAARHQVPVLVVWAERQPDGLYRMQYFVADDAIRDADARVAATALNRAVERCIASSPAQYQWAYRRFAPVTPEQANPYRRS